MVLAVEIEGRDELSFAPDTRSYDAPAPEGTSAVLVRAVATETNAKIWVDLDSANGRDRIFPTGVVGKVEASVPLGPAPNVLRITVLSSRGAHRNYTVAIHRGQTFPCNEEGLLAAADAGKGVHRFQCEDPTTIATSDTLWLREDVILDGAGALTLDANRAHSLVLVPGGVTAQLRGFGLTRGSSIGGGVGAISNAGILELRECSLFDNGGPNASGGAIGNSGILRIEDSVIENNVAEYGGAINLRGRQSSPDGDATILRTRIVNNIAFWRAGAIYAEGNVTIVDSEISSNQAGNHGGAIYCNPREPDVLTIRGTTIDGNESGGDGGGIHCNAGRVEVAASTVSNNVASGQGGGAYFRTVGLMRFVNATISGNRSGDLGGGFATGGPFELLSTTLVNNVSDETDEASALFVEGGFGTNRIRNTLISGSCVYCGWAPPTQQVRVLFCPADCC